MRKHKGKYWDDESVRLLVEFGNVLHNRLARRKTLEGKVRCEKRTALEYCKKLRRWIECGLVRDTPKDTPHAH